jgi:hypothetical protein
MRALRIMTWNVRLFSANAAAFQDISHTAPDDALKIVKLIAALSDPPDVIAFNEVYDEEAATNLRDGLRDDANPPYTHSLKTFGSPKLSVPPKFDDSGLMVVSRFPFLARPNGDHFEFRSYEAAEGDDALSDKGAGLVQIAVDGEIVTLVFTHLQASYDEHNSEYAGTRAAQMDVISSLLREVMGDPVLDLQQWRHVVVMGDLNVRGDRWARTLEWPRVFASPSPKAGGFGLGTTPGQAELTDGWNTYMGLPTIVAPFMPSTPDPGFTNHNPTFSPDDPTSLYRSRLDYQCYMREPTTLTRTLTPHHMMTRLKAPSDHWSLEALAQYYSSFCNPSDAMNLFAPDPRASARIALFSGKFVDLRRVVLKFEHPGSYQWIYFERGGSFSFLFPDDTRHEAYAASDLTHPLRSEEPLDVTQAPPHVTGALHQLGVEGRPASYALPPMSLLRFRAADPNFTGEHVIGILRHRGDSPATSIFLPHDRETNPYLPTEPVGGPGTSDVCWFKATRPKLLTDQPYAARFTLFNRNTMSFDRTARWTLRQPDEQTIAQLSGKDAELTIEHSVTGGGFVYVTLERSDVVATSFTARWTAPLSALYLEEPLNLYCNDETGIDRVGSDEITVKLYLDGETEAFYEIDWEADTGEELALREGVGNALRLRLQNAGLPQSVVPFVTGIRVEVAEDDGLLGTSTANVFLTPATESDKKNVQLGMGVQSGRYSLNAVVGKWRF